MPVRSEKEEQKGERSSCSPKETLFCKCRLVCRYQSILGAVLTVSFPLLGQAAFSGVWSFLYLNYSNGDFARM